MSPLKVGSPVNLCMANEEEEGPKEDPLGPLTQNLRKKQAEDESAKVEGQPESEQRTKFHPLPSLQLQADISIFSKL